MVLFLQILNALAFALIGVASLRSWRRRPSASYAWFGFIFAVLSLLLAVAVWQTLAGDDALRTKVTLGLLVLVPTGFVCFAASFGGWGSRARWLAAAASLILMTASSFTPVGLGSEHMGLGQTLYLLGLLGFWILASAAVIARLWQVAADQPAIARKRMRTLALGVAASVGSLLIAGTLNPSDTAAATGIYLFGILSALGFAAGLIPPRLLLSYWRDGERDRVFDALDVAMSSPSLEQAVELVLQPAASLLGGQGAVVQTLEGQSYVWGNAPPPYPQRLDEPSVIRQEQYSLVVLPMEYGQMTVSTSRQAPMLGSEDLRLGKMLATMVDMLFEREAHQNDAVARGQAEERNLLLQQAVLPETLPRLERVELAARYLPAGLAEQVGGDFYDVFALGPDKIALVVGDVAGKGLPAAALMGRIRNAAWATLRLLADPCQTVGHLEEILDEVPSHRMTTLVCAVLDTRLGQLSYVCAGHPPPLLVRAHGEVELLECSRPPLGSGPIEASSQLVSLAPGDRLLFYTDGLIERRRLDLLGQIEQLKQAALAAEAGVEPLVETVLKQMLGERAHPADDCALLALGLQTSEPRQPALAEAHA